MYAYKIIVFSQNCRKSIGKPPTPTCSGLCVAVTPSDRRDWLWLFRGGGLTASSAGHMLGTSRASGNTAHSWFDWALALIGPVSAISTQGAFTHVSCAHIKGNWLEACGFKHWIRRDRHAVKLANGWVRVRRPLRTSWSSIRQRNYFIRLVS